MARCEDCIHQECCVRFAGARTLLCGEKADERCKMFKSTADVVPRAMTAEIFEEIEKVIGEQYENYVFDNLDIEGAEQDAIIAFVDVMKRHFAELKKKHTEGGE